MKKPKNLTDKQWAFVLEYPKDWNATQAAIRAGYSKDTSYSIGWENLKKPEIAEAIKMTTAHMAMTLDEMWARIADIARDDKASEADKLAAMRLVGRGQAAFVDKVVQDTNLNIKISFEDGE